MDDLPPELEDLIDGVEKQVIMTSDLMDEALRKAFELGKAAATSVELDDALDASDLVDQKAYAVVNADGELQDIRYSKKGVAIFDGHHARGRAKAEARIRNSHFGAGHKPVKVGLIILGDL